MLTCAIGFPLCSHPLVREPAHLVHVRALDADEPRRPLASRRVEIALVVDVRHARLERVARDETHLAGLVLGGGLDERPVAHHGLPPGLTVDRPGRAVVVRVTLPGALVDVGENAEAELRVLVEDLAFGPVVLDMGSDEGVVLQHILDDLAHLFPAPGARIVREGALTGGGEPLERPTHGMTSSVCLLTPDRSRPNGRHDRAREPPRSSSAGSAPAGFPSRSTVSPLTDG